MNYTNQQYKNQLQEKQARLKGLLSPYIRSLEPAQLSVYASPIKNFRMRAEFRVWHEGDDLFYIMFKPGSKEHYRIDSFPIASQLINRLMQPVIERIKKSPILRHRLFQIDYLTGQSGEALISLLYHKPLAIEWEQAARVLHQELQAFGPVHLIGRARKQKILINTDKITEHLNINGQTYLFEQVENSFTQPNAAVNEKMIEWALQMTQNSSGDLLELYCGNGNFSLPLAQNFQKVLGTEISRTSVDSAQKNIQLNQIQNVTIARFSAEEFAAAMAGQFESRRVDSLQLEDYDFQTILVDPPRAGLDKDTLNLVSKFSTILYISCNPDTLAANLEDLRRTHQVEAYALFDQFPYTEHIEAGVLLKSLGTL